MANGATAGLDPVQALTEAINGLAAAFLTAKNLPDAVILQVIGNNPVIDSTTGKESTGLQQARTLVWETWKDYINAEDISQTSGAVQPPPPTIYGGRAAAAAPAAGAASTVAQVAQAAGSIVTPVLSALAAGS